MQDTISIEATKYNSIYPSNTINSEVIDKTEKSSIRNLNGLLGGVFIADYGSNSSGNIYFRGFGNRFNGSGLSLFIDGIPMLDGMETSVILNNLAEIRMGQQNINNSGLASIDISTESSMKERTEISIGIGNYRSGDLGINHNAKLFDAIYYGLYFICNVSDGWEMNTWNGNYANGYNKYLGGLRLEGNLGNNIYSLTKLEFHKTNEDAFTYRMLYNGELLPLKLNDASNYKSNLFMISERLDFQLSDKLYLLSLTSFVYMNDDMFLDQDFSEENIFTLNQKQNRKRLTQELRFHINNSNKFNHTIGAFISYENNEPYTADVLFKRTGIENLIENNVTSNIPQYVNYKILDSNFLIPNIFTNQKLSLSSYYNFIFNNFLIDDFSFEGTLKFDYFNDKLNYDVYSSLTQSYDITYYGMNIDDVVNAEYKATGNASNNHFQFSPKILFSYKLNQKDKLFGSIVRGYKNGGYNIQMLSDVVQNNLRVKMIDGLKESVYDKLTDAGMPTEVINSVILSKFPSFYYFNGNIGDILYYKPEESYSFEVGYNNIFSNFDFSAKLFFITINQLQLTQFSPNGFGRMLTNSGEANSKGIEINLSYKPIDALTFIFNYNFSDARFTKYIDSVKTNNEMNVVDFSGNRIPYAPSHLFNLNAIYSHNFSNSTIIHNIFFQLEYSGAAGIYWNEANSFSQNYYSILNAKIGIKIDGGITFELYGKNITNEKYYTFYFESLSKDFYQLAKPFQCGVRAICKLW